MRRVLDRIASLPVPVIAAMNGDAYGGGAEFSVACDIRIAADDIKMAFNQVRLGIMPAWGGIERLADIVGPAKALYLMTTGEVVTAEHAQAWGLLERVVPRPEFELVWRSVAATMAGVPRASLAGIKEVLRAHRPAVNPATFDRAVDVFAHTWVSDDHWRMVEEMNAARRATKG
jgi:enoyl-CoA hydratase/carnithine racemase